MVSIRVGHRGSSPGLIFPLAVSVKAMDSEKPYVS